MMKRAVPILLLLLSLCGCGAPQKVDRDGFAMGTYIRITVYNTRHADKADACLDAIAGLEAEVSVNNPDSQISRVNAQGGGLLTGDAARIMETAMYVAEASDGAFSPALLPLKSLWDIENKNDGDAPPTDAEIDAAMKLCSYEVESGNGHVSASDDSGSQHAVSITLPDGGGLDLGGIAKGYAGDKCAALLKEAGVDNAIINLGGNVRTVGDREFRIGLRNPRAASMAANESTAADGSTASGAGNQAPSESYGVVTVGEGNVITSGDYERLFETGGERYHHIFDPSTGSPARSGLISATAIHEDGALADGMSTAIFVLGKEKGLALAESMGCEAIVVDEEYSVYCTDGIRDRLEIIDDSYMLK